MRLIIPIYLFKQTFISVVRGRDRIFSCGGWQTVRSSFMDFDQQAPSANLLADLDINVNLKPFFINTSVTLDQHIQAQTTNLSPYLATLFTSDENNVEIDQKAKTCALAAAWCRHDHKLANNILRH
ncbi:unnamed protein product [Rotaria sp. Silwood1]|nr:unnamed protein product [Rotaria sp. Silwood1]CAF1682725.1 unnamed protein product [Rotaria sp. Silwood1]CAF3754364.1 unnamed protein product [Rotaria sp. Silwood1]CAF3758040.1 unnamed protein product [Rotaria sp. Silwood1]CAF3885793.1 unnamed protein product [Rotaria sp. Silwood1]